MAMVQGAASIDSNLPRDIKDNYKRGLSYMASSLWNKLPTDGNQA